MKINWLNIFNVNYLIEYTVDWNSDTQNTEHKQLDDIQCLFVRSLENGNVQV